MSDLAPAEPPLADPRTKPVSIEITNTSTIAENVSSIFDTCWSIFLDFLIHYYSHPLFGYLSYQTLFDETPVQEQESGSSPIDNDPTDVGNNLAVDPHTTDSPIRHTPDGKEVTCLFYCNNHELKIFLAIVDTNTRSLEPIQPNVIGAPSAVPSLQIEATIEKVLYPLHHSLCYKLIQTS